MLQAGRIRIHLLNDGRLAMDGGAMFGIVPKPLWSREFPSDDRNRIPMSLHCPVAIDGKDVIVTDTGVGERLSEKERDIYAIERDAGLPGRLRELGIDPEDVTHVVLTHLHFDHVGGVIRRDGAGHAHPAFPRARHFVQKAELDLALNPGNERMAAAYGHAPECLEPLRAANLVEVVEGDTNLTSRLRVVLTGGHTPAHQCPVFTDGDEGFVHLGDIAPTRAHLRPAWNQAFDVDPLGTLEAKKKLLTEAAEQRWWVSFDHDHQVACAKLGPSWSKKGEVADAVGFDTA